VATRVGVIAHEIIRIGRWQLWASGVRRHH